MNPQYIIKIDTSHIESFVNSKDYFTRHVIFRELSGIDSGYYSHFKSAYRPILIPSGMVFFLKDTPYMVSSTVLCNHAINTTYIIPVCLKYDENKCSLK